MWRQKYSWFLVPVFCMNYLYAAQQESNIDFHEAKPSDVDTTFVYKFKRPNDIRLFMEPRDQVWSLGPSRKPMLRYRLLSIIMSMILWV